MTAGSGDVIQGASEEGWDEMVGVMHARVETQGGSLKKMRNNSGYQHRPVLLDFWKIQ